MPRMWRGFGSFTKSNIHIICVSLSRDEAQQCEMKDIMGIHPSPLLLNMYVLQYNFVNVIHEYIISTETCIIWTCTYTVCVIKKCVSLFRRTAVLRGWVSRSVPTSFPFLTWLILKPFRPLPVPPVSYRSIRFRTILYFSGRGYVHAQYFHTI